MKAAYFRNYYHNKEMIELFDENLKIINRFEINIDSFGNITFEETGLPLPDGIQKIVKRTDHVDALLETEDIPGTDYRIVKGFIKKEV